MKLQSPTRLFAYDQPGQRICRLCFGCPVEQRQVQHSGYIQTIHEFLPTQLFGVVWWNRRSDGEQHRALAVVEALETTRLSIRIGMKIPDVSAKVLVHTMLEQRGPAGGGGPVDQFLMLLDQIRDSGSQPEKLPSIIFQMIGHKIRLIQTFPGSQDESLPYWNRVCLN
jgi:hypothetical protein